MKELRDYKEEFIQIFTDKIKREGSNRVLEYLKGCDFFTAPASSKFHSNFKTGLCEHTVKVYERFIKLVNEEKLNNPDFAKLLEKQKITDESLAIIALLHDICKCNFYKEDTRNVKENGEWTTKSYYSINEKFSYGHGEKSVFIIQQLGLILTEAEAISINWHMGGFDSRVKGGDSSISRAFTDYPIALLFHIADSLSSYLDERIVK